MNYIYSDQKLRFKKEHGNILILPIKDFSDMYEFDGDSCDVSGFKFDVYTGSSFALIKNIYRRKYYGAIYHVTTEYSEFTILPSCKIEIAGNRVEKMNKLKSGDIIMGNRFWRTKIISIDKFYNDKDYVYGIEVQGCHYSCGCIIHDEE